MVTRCLQPEMTKPETVARLCVKCHSKTVHEIREKTVTGSKLVCTDCGNSLVVPL